LDGSLCVLSESQSLRVAESQRAALLATFATLRLCDFETPRFGHTFTMSEEYGRNADVLYDIDPTIQDM